MQAKEKSRGLIRMTEHEIARELENHKQQIGSLKHRMDDQEAQGKIMQELTTSVELLAVNMKGMLEAQKEQGVRLSKLEGEPGENWKNIKRMILTAIISTIVGALITGYFL